MDDRPPSPPPKKKKKKKVPIDEYSEEEKDNVRIATNAYGYPTNTDEKKKRARRASARDPSSERELTPPRTVRRRKESGSSARDADGKKTLDWKDVIDGPIEKPPLVKPTPEFARNPSHVPNANDPFAYIAHQAHQSVLQQIGGSRQSQPPPGKSVNFLNPNFMPPNVSAAQVAAGLKKKQKKNRKRAENESDGSSSTTLSPVRRDRSASPAEILTVRRRPVKSLGQMHNQALQQQQAQQHQQTTIRIMNQPGAQSKLALAQQQRQQQHQVPVESSGSDSDDSDSNATGSDSSLDAGEMMKMIRVYKKIKKKDKKKKKKKKKQLEGFMKKLARKS